MEHGIPALIIASVMIVATLLIARSGYMGVDAVNQSFKEMESRVGEQARTNIALSDTASDSAGTNLTATVTNTGSTVLGDWDYTDVVVQYIDDVGGYNIRWLAFTGGALSSNTWTVNAITNDVFEPGLLNPTEDMQIQLRINPVIGCGTTGTMIFTTEQGVTSTANVAGPPCP